MDGRALMDINTFASPPTQYEVKNWLFGRGHVANTSVSLSHRVARVSKEGLRGRDGRHSRKNEGDGEAGSRPLRHSVHGGAPLEKEKQERVKLKKGHRKARSDGYHHLMARGEGQNNTQYRLQRAANTVEKDAVAAEQNRNNRSSRHMSTSSQRSGQGNRFSFHLQVLKGARDSVASNAGSGDTLVGSAGSMESPSPSPTCMRFSGSSFSKTRQKPSPACIQQPATSFPNHSPDSSPKSPCLMNLTPPTSHFHPTKTSFDHHSISSAASRSHASMDPTMDEKPKVHKALNAFRQSTLKVKEEDYRVERKETDQAITSHGLRPQRSLAQTGRRIHRARHSASYHVVNLSHSPPPSPSYTPHRHAYLHSTDYGSLCKTNASLGLKYHYSLDSLSQGRNDSIAISYRPVEEQIDLADKEEESNPALLGSFDYHNFLCGSANRRTALTMGPISAAQPAASNPKHSAKIKSDNGDGSSPHTVIRSRSISSQTTPAPTPAHQQAFHQYLKNKKSLPLLDRRAQRLQDLSSDTGVVVTFSPQYPTLEALQNEDSSGCQDAGVHHSAEVNGWENTSKATHSKHFSSHLKQSRTTPDTAAAASKSSAAPSLLIGGSPFPSQISSQPDLPRTPLQAPFPSVLHDGRPISSHSTSQLQIPRAQRSPADPARVLAPRSRLHREPPTPGSAGSISYTEIDPEKMKPFVGPLPEQQPPPTKPLPRPPIARMKCLDIANSSEDTDKEADGSVLRSSSKVPSETKTLAKQTTKDVKPKNRPANRSGDSLVTKTGQGSVKDKRHLLRKKISTLFGEETFTPTASHSANADHDAVSISTYRPISMNSLEADDPSFFDIFDDVFNAARDSASASQRSDGPSFNSGRPSLSVLSEDVVVDETASRDVTSFWPAVQPVSRDEVAERLAARLGLIDAASRITILEALTQVAPIVPPLTDHPAIRGDLPLQARLGMIADFTHGGRDSAGSRGRAIHRQNHVAAIPTHIATPTTMTGSHVAPLNVGRQRPTQVAVSTRHASRSTAVEPLTGFTTRSLVAVPTMAKGQHDVDPSPAFDRTVDLTWYRYVKDAGRGFKESSLPYLPAKFDALSTVFMVKYSRGRESKSTDYSQLRRFAYSDLEGPIRFQIMEKLLEDYLPGKPVLLNHSRQAAPAWSDDTFATLWDILAPLQNVLWACPHLRADVMTAIFMIQPFHVIFSPLVKPITQPLPTKWLFKYLYFMQDVRVELDMTKLGFSHVWQATGLSTRLWDIGNLVHVFVDEVLKRDPRTNPMGQLTIHCRRYFGYRQGENPHRGDIDFYISPAGEDSEQKPGNHPMGQPWNYGRKPPSLPPSANNPYSGHRRHHTGGPERVPFLHEDHMSVANPFHKLTGRVYSVRMVGMSEKWSMDLLKFWPKSEYDEIPKENLGLHIDRYTPSRHTYAAPGHAIFLDYGVRAGIHRFPPLPDSEPMVCTTYDEDNDVFLEVGSGNILTVKENGVEIIARSSNPPMLRSDLPFRRGSSFTLNFVDAPMLRNPSPAGATTSPTKQIIKKGTPQKALQLLGLDDGENVVVTPSASPTLQGDDEDLVTPMASRSTSTVLHASRRQISTDMGTDDKQSSRLASDHCRSSSVTSSTSLATEKSYLCLNDADRRKPSGWRLAT